MTSQDMSTLMPAHQRSGRTVDLWIPDPDRIDPDGTHVFQIDDTHYVAAQAGGDVHTNFTIPPQFSGDLAHVVSAAFWAAAAVAARVPRNQPMSPQRAAVHASHCCTEHGCTYGAPNCPVTRGTVTQQYPCEHCE